MLFLPASHLFVLFLILDTKMFSTIRVCFGRKSGLYWTIISSGVEGLNLLPCCNNNSQQLCIPDFVPWWKMSNSAILHHAYRICLILLTFQKELKGLIKIRIYLGVCAGEWFEHILSVLAAHRNISLIYRCLHFLNIVTIIEITT